MKTILFVTSLVFAVLTGGCSDNKQEELAAKQVQEREQAEKNKAEGQKALTSKKGFNPFKD